MSDMIALSMPIADTAGAVILRLAEESGTRSGQRRVSRTKTLDGGCVIYDAGFSHSDRTFNLQVWIDEPTWEKVWALFIGYSLINLATAEGFFTACIESAAKEENQARLTILIKEKIA